MKYKFTDETRVVNGVTLRRIESLVYIPRVVIPGQLGGFIENISNLSGYDTCWVGDNACVYGDANIRESAYVYGNARVFGNAWVAGDTYIFDCAKVYDDARVFGRVTVYGYACVYGDAYLDGFMDICGCTHINSTGQLKPKNKITFFACGMEFVL